MVNKAAIYASAWSSLWLPNARRNGRSLTHQSLLSLADEITKVLATPFRY